MVRYEPFTASLDSFLKNEAANMTKVFVTENELPGCVEIQEQGQQFAICNLLAKQVSSEIRNTSLLKANPIKTGFGQRESHPKFQK